MSLSPRDATRSVCSDNAGCDEKIASSRYSAGKASENESNLADPNDLHDKSSCNAHPSDLFSSTQATHLIARPAADWKTSLAKGNFCR